MFPVGDVQVSFFMRFYFIRFKYRLYVVPATFSGFPDTREDEYCWLESKICGVVSGLNKKKIRIAFTANGKREVRFAFS